MIKSITSFVAAIAVILFASLTGQASAQHCSSCASAPAQSCSSCASANAFGFPAAPAPVAAGCGRKGCLGHGKIRGHVDEVRRQLDHTAEINSKIAARNDAWPLPFACADKRDYYQIWDTMLSAGAETHAVLDSNYFTGENQLNRVGIDRVAGIILNMPSNERTVYVNRGVDEAVNRARVESIRDTISTYYAHVSGVDVRLSDHLSQSVSGRSVLELQERTGSVQPPAIIPVGSGESVSASVGE